VARISFKDKVVLITGASAGIGRALSREFAMRGAHLAMGSLPEEKDDLAAWAFELESRFGVRTWTFPINLLDENGPERLYREVKEKAGNVYALVNNAGMITYGTFWEIPWERHLSTVRLNLLAPMRLMHLFLPDMLSRREGVVFNISSVAALHPTPFQNVYGATKAGLQSFSQATRAELRRSGVLVCTLNPPFIETRLLETEGYPQDLRYYSICGKKSPEWCARKAIEAFEKGKIMYIPGVVPNIIHNLLVRLSMRPVVDLVSWFFLQGRKKQA
jgi:uncharacterized protein